MGRGASSSGGGSRGGSFSGGSSRGMSRSSFNSGRSNGHGSHTTVFIGGGYGNYHSSGSPWVGIVVGVIFVLTGLFCVFGGFGQLIGSANYASVSAKCVDNDLVGGWYYTTYEYTVNGTEYTNRSTEGWEFPESIGKVVTIYYLKSNPNQITEEKPNSASEGGIFIFVGLICAGIGAIPLAICIKEIKKNKEASSTESNNELVYEQPKEEQTKKCPYCGCKYNRNSDSCPKCGASRID